MRGGRGLFLRRKISFSGSKNRFLAGSAPGDSERILAETVKAENPLGFQVSPKAKLPTAKSKILTRHRGVCLHSYNDTANANAEVIIESYLSGCSSLRSLS